jgi:hypothetical protein
MLDQFPDHFVGAAERRMGGFDFAGLMLCFLGKLMGFSGKWPSLTSSGRRKWAKR